MTTHFDSELTFGIDPAVGTVSRVGDLVVIRTQDPVAVWDAVTTSATTKATAVSEVADELARLGVTVEITGQQGLVARLGAGVDSARGRFTTGSRRVQLGDRLGSASLVRARIPKGDPRIAAAGAGAVAVAGVVAFSLRRRRSGRKAVARRRAEHAVGSAADVLAEVRNRGKEAIPLLAGALDTARASWESGGGSERLKAARTAATPHAEQALRRGRELAERAQKEAAPVARDLAERVQRDVVPMARDLAERALAEVGPRAQEFAERARTEIAPKAQDAVARSTTAGKTAVAKFANHRAALEKQAGKRGCRPWRKSGK